MKTGITEKSGGFEYKSLKEIEHRNDMQMLP